jgi:hypothetical protein
MNAKRGARRAFLLTACPLLLLTACSHPWVDSHGHRVPRQKLLETTAGCKGGPEWGILVIGGQRFIHDPKGEIPPEVISSPYQENAHLPSDAKWAGYRQGNRGLWTSPSDAQAIYMVAPGRVERWPLQTGTFGCV